MLAIMLFCSEPIVVEPPLPVEFPLELLALLAVDEEEADEEAEADLLAELSCSGLLCWPASRAALCCTSCWPMELLALFWLLFFLLFVDSFRFLVWIPSFFIVIGLTDCLLDRRD